MKTSNNVIALPAAIAAHAPRTWVSYNRKSNSRGLDQRFNSLDAQEKRAEEYAAPHTTWKFAGHYSDGGKSGRTLNRPNFRRMLADAQAGKFDTVVVYKMDRLARTVLNFAKIEDLFKPYGVRFVFVTTQYEDNPEGRFRQHLDMALAELELDRTTQRTTDKLKSTRKEGIWVGGQLPLGYDRKDKRLQINQFEARTVRDIFALYLEHRSTGAVARVLRQKGYNTKERKWKETTRHARMWTKAAVLGILKNPTYAGYVADGETLYEGEHDRIIARDIFEQVQSILKHNAIDGETHGENPAYYLRGVLRCASATNDGTPCGHGFVPASTRKGKREFRYYRCAGREKLGRDVCPCKHLAAEAIETYVTEQIRAAVSDPEFMAKVRASIEGVRGYCARAVAYRETLVTSEGELATQGLRIADNLRGAKDGARVIYEREINALGDKLGDTRRRIDRMSVCIERLKHAEVEGLWMTDQLARFGDAWPLMSGELRARIVNAIIDAIHINETDNVVEIVFEPFGRDLPAAAEFDEHDARALGPVPEPLRGSVREPLFRARGRSVSFDTKAPVVRLPVRRAAKVAHMLALAHHMDRAIREGRFEDRATVARYLEMTRARVTYLLQLTLLAPDIQETILYLYSLDGVEPLAERVLWPIARAGTWARQRKLWAQTVAPLLGSKGAK